MKQRRINTTRGSQAGFSLLELMVAMVILLVGVLAITSVLTVALASSVKQGSSSRTTELCQDKMEQLLALSFTDASSDTTQFPTAAAGGTGLAAGGGTSTSAPVAGYVDYLDATGNLTTANRAAFTRVWQIVDTSATLKTITVVTTAVATPGSTGSPPSTTLVSMKSSVTL